MAVVYTNFFGGAFFDGGFFGAGTEDSTKTGTGGIDGEGHKRVPFKPTGITDRPRKEGRKEVADRVEESREIQAEIAGRLAREFGEETQANAVEQARQQKIELMSQAQIDMEIGILLRKKIKTQEDELMLVLMMAAAAA